MDSNSFNTLSRQKFRQYFQPSRILLGIFPAPTKSGVNIITLCFHMYCSYKPPMMAIAVQNINATYHLIEATEEFVLAVPGVSLVAETLYCDTHSMSEADKVEELKLNLIASKTVRTPGLRDAIANVEVVKTGTIVTGDHVVCVGRVSRFAVRNGVNELPLLSIGPDITGYKVLAKSGIHRIGTVISREVDSKPAPEVADHRGR